MRKRMIAAVVAAASCTTILAGTAGPAAADGGHHGPAPTLAEILLSDGNQFDLNPFDYDIVTEAVLLFPELVAAASNPDAELTVFLPNDWAFRRLVADITDLRPRREQAVFDAIAALGTDTVATVLHYHIVAGPPISFEAAKQSDGAVLTTLQGGTITVDVEGRWWRKVRLIDLDPDAADPRVIQPEVGGHASNGFAHGINRVLRPLDL
jgi:uncharacterized surface protein with fasciclin (FAS1) repeats